MDPAGLGDLPMELSEKIISLLDWKSLLAISRVRLLLIIPSLWTIILGLRQIPQYLQHCGKKPLFFPHSLRHLHRDLGAAGLPASHQLSQGLMMCCLLALIITLGVAVAGLGGLEPGPGGGQEADICSLQPAQPQQTEV